MTAGFFHECALYDSEDTFLALAVPFVEDGLRAGHPTFVACAEDNTALLRGALGRDDAVTYLPAADQYARPADAIASYREICAKLVSAGATGIHVVGDVPHPGVGAPWDWWARYEAAVNRAYAEFPLHGLCPYDTRTTPDYVLADVASTHPNVAGQGTPNPHYGAPLSAPRPDVLEQAPPLVELVDPTPSAVRGAVLAAIAGVRLDEDSAHDAVYAASEIITNGLTHGVGPVRFRLWADAARVVVATTDHGTGPSDPLVGLMPTEATQTAGLGLWILHRTCNYVSMGRGDDGFTVRVSVGA
ncbi:sensor histidine kinase [Lentzea sp. NPDC042327]|uniref:sensor histidine kinase n=1 Tax=Lentzea sp. NPDC042327 TaxID=3154801 RepID=UPI0034117C49